MVVSRRFSLPGLLPRLLLGAMLVGGGALAQEAGRPFGAEPGGPAVQVPLPELPAGPGSAPVTFSAERVQYDRDSGVVTAEGSVEAWQDGRVLRADRLSYDRNTGIVRLSGNVQLLEANGQVLFLDEADLTAGFREGTMFGLRALLPANGRMAAAGARRLSVPGQRDATVTDLSRIVYSTCDLCATDPSRPPLWQVRARQATIDTVQQRMSYRDATVEIGGVPVFYLPSFSHPSPEAPRSSGLLFPTVGQSRFLGPFIQTPFFWVINDSADAVITPLFSTRQAPNIGLEYRQRFNRGDLQIQASAGYFVGVDTPRAEFSGHIFSRFRYHLDENWRMGAEFNRATSELYLRTYRFEWRRVLTSQAYLEGFWGTEGFARFDARLYQGLRSTDANSRLPIVAPNLFAEWSPRTPVLGGRLTADIGALGISREIGSFSQRLAARIGWERHDIDPLGALWTTRMQGDVRSYYATRQETDPIYQPLANGFNGTGNVRAAVDWRLPLVRSVGRWGQQTIEPRVQFVTGPNTGNQARFPNEDSIDFEFTDANLFALNRFPGRDRQEGGTRLDWAMRGAWNFPNGGQIETLVGRSWRVQRDSAFFQGSGLERNWSDWVGRLSVTPTPWLDFTVRSRLDGQNGEHRFTDLLASGMFRNVGPFDQVTLHAGFIYTTPQPFLTPVRARNEVVAGFSVSHRAADGGRWRVAGSARYDIELERAALVTGSIGYEDECFIIEGRYIRRFAQDPLLGRNVNNSLLLLRVGFKTIGDFSFRAL